MRIFALSDTHILDHEDPLYAPVLRMIRDQPQSGDVLVLGGDIFDLLIGDQPQFRARYSEFFRVLKDAGERGVEIHYIEGNHDFFLKRVFSEVPGLRVHTEEIEMERAGVRFYFAHGDLVDRKDYGYLALRAVFRSPITWAAQRFAPGSWVDQFGKKSSQISSQKTRRTPKIERLEYLRKTYRSYAATRLAEGFDFVVLGHCHDLDQMEFKIDGRTGYYFNLGYPRAHGVYWCWDSVDRAASRLPL